MMIPLQDIGAPQMAPEQTPDQRRRTLRAIVPMGGGIREVEAFDGRSAQNLVQEIVTSDNSSLRFLRLSRIALDVQLPDYQTVERIFGDEEAVFYVNRGQAILYVREQKYVLERGDVLYVGIQQAVLITTETSCDLNEFRAIECHTSYPNRHIRHSDIEGTPLAANLGTKRTMSQRTVYKLVDQNIQANRLLFGDTYLAHSGAVGSYPPHFHGPDGPHGLGANAKEELYHFRCESDLPNDIPYVLQNCALPEEKVNVYVHVFDDTVVNVTPTYHDTIAPPAVRFMFTWCLASFTEGHRDWSEIYNKPGYEQEW
jgi:4-deoxy-L-threo-5-hexosulose-uronate ketol-isomerase